MTATTTEPGALVIGTADQNYAWAKAVTDGAAADVAEAKAALDRATEDYQRIANWQASVAAAGAPPHIMNAVNRMVEPARTKHIAAHADLAAATDFHARCRKVLESATVDAQHMGRGFGPWYGN